VFEREVTAEAGVPEAATAEWVAEAGEGEPRGGGCGALRWKAGANTEARLTVAPSDDAGSVSLKRSVFSVPPVFSFSAHSLDYVKNAPKPEPSGKGVFFCFVRMATEDRMRSNRVGVAPKQREKEE